MEIVSGLGEKPHVTSQQFRQILEGTIGQKSYFIKYSSRKGVTIEDYFQ